MRGSILVLMLTTGTSVFAVANMQEDCAALATHYKVDASEVTPFKEWCARFEARCYKIEDTAVESCGKGGALQAKADKTLAAGSAGVDAAGPAYSTTGKIGQATCQSLNDVRDEQLAGCDRDARKCSSLQASFPSALPNAPLLKCTVFGPESEKWSKSAKGTESICKAIRADRDQVAQAARVELRQCEGISDVVQSTGGQGTEQVNSAYKFDQPGGRQCSLFGCAQNEDGTYSPRMAPTSFGGASPSSLSDAPRATPAPPAIKLNYPDAKACGLGGCQKNEDGTYTPIRF